MQWLCDLFANTTFTTVFAGVVVFIIGQMFIELIVKPMKKFKKLKADTVMCLWRYRPKFMKEDIAHNAVQELSARFVAYTQEKPFWLSRKKLLKCAHALNQMSRCKSGFELTEAENVIVKILDLKGFNKLYS